MVRSINAINTTDVGGTTFLRILKHIVAELGIIIVLAAKNFSEDLLAMWHAS